jgi:hypothetical protein
MKYRPINPIARARRRARRIAIGNSLLVLLFAVAFVAIYVVPLGGAQ